MFQVSNNVDTRRSRLPRVPNSRLVRLRRERLWTQEDVANRLVDLIDQATGRLRGIDADYISRLERGKIVWPNQETRAALRQLFDATDTELGFYNPKISEPPAAVGDLPTHSLVHLAEQATFGRLEAGDLLLPHLQPTQRIRSGDVGDFHAMIDMWEHFDHSRGGLSSFRGTVLTQVAQAEQSLGSASFEGDSVRRDWMSAVSRAARLAAFSSFDAGQYDIARRAFLLAQQAAAEADDWPARINILCGMARQAVYTGRPEDALKLVSLARVGEDMSSATTRAMIGSVRARTFAALGRGKDTMRAVGEAEDAFAARDQSADPPFLWYYDEAQIAGDTGHALFDLALVDENYVEAADQRLEKAVDLHTADATRSRSFSLCKLTRLRLRWNPGQESLQLATAATDAVSKVRSGRARDDLAAIGAELAGHDSPAAHQLSNRIVEAIAA